MIVARAVTTILLFLTCASATQAQERWRRAGFWFEMGGGFTSTHVACATCSDVSRTSSTGNYVRLGGRVSDRVLLGFETFSTRNDLLGLGSGEQSVVAENSSAAAVALWYPWLVRAFVKGGLGYALGRFTVDPLAQDSAIVRGSGVGLTFGGGFDQPVWRGLAVTGSADVWFTAIGDIVLASGRIDDVIASLYSISIGITIR